MCLIFTFLFSLLFYLFLNTLTYPMPVNDAGSIRYRTFPWMTLAIIAVNTIGFFAWIAPDLYKDAALYDEAVRSYTTKIWEFGYRETVIRQPTGIGALATFTSLFMHADLWHLFSNMVYLWAFGRRIEDACGHGRFLAFYLFAGMVANVGGVLLNPATDDLPGIGASGAIAGVMGAYLLLFPGAWIVTLWGIGAFLRLPVALIRRLGGERVRVFSPLISLPAWLVLIAFAVQNAAPSLETIMRGSDSGGVNYLAHLTGFLAALGIFLFVRKDLLMRYISGRSL